MKREIEQYLEWQSDQFMVPDIEERDMYAVDGPCGIDHVPAELVDVPEDDGADDWLDRAFAALADYTENTEAYSIERESGWYARLSAPGYLDCTDWDGPFTTEEEAAEHLYELYADDMPADDE